MSSKTEELPGLKKRTMDKGQLFTSDEKLYMQKCEGDSSLPAKEEEQLSKLRVFLLNVSWFGMNVMYLILSVEVVPSQVHALVGSEMKAQVFGAMVACGAVITFIISPLIGVHSDRFASPYGKRRPMMVGGTILLVISLFGMAFSAPGSERLKANATCSIDLELRRCAMYFGNNITLLEGLDLNSTQVNSSSVLLALMDNQPSKTGNLGLYFVFYLCVMACYAMVAVPYNGLIADQTPSTQRGFSSGVMGAMTLLGNLAGALIGFFFNKIGVVPTYATISGLYFVCVILTVCSCSERPTYKTNEKCDVHTILSSYWGPLKEHDFRWVFFTRFLMQQGVATVVGFLEFWLGDMVELPSCWTPEKAVAVILLPLLFSAALFSVVGGFLSDRLRKRKPLVIGSAALMAVCSFMLSFIGLQGKYAFYSVIPVSLTFGIGFGAYSAVDFALVMDVLPDDKDKAKDLAVWHQALVLPQAIATPIGGIVLDGFNHVSCRWGLGYIILFLITCVYFAISAYMVRFIRKAK